jgi:uncharacterized protein related to proFAR isomerase
MIRGKVFWIKEKQAFIKENSTLRLIGKPFDIAKKAKDDGIKIIHIVDLDAQKGLKTNFDVYDKLTYIINIEVEGVKDEEFIKKLLGINARVVIDLPTSLDLEKFKERSSLLVGKVSSNITAKDLENVKDVIIEPYNEKLVELAKNAGKRIIVYNNDYKKMENKEIVFAVLQ